MATMQAELDLAFVQVGTEIKNTRTIIGLLTGLTTTDKSSIVAAINEIKAAGSVTINDTTASGSSVYSSNKVNSQIAQAKSDILGGAGTTVDTLKEIADLLVASDVDDDAALAALTTAVGNRLRFDAAQSLTSGQKTQGNTNLGSVALADLGDPAHSYKTVFLAALA